MSPDQWQAYLRDIVDAERAFVRREGGRTVLRGPSPMEMMDAAYEDPQGRLPHEPGYDTGGEVVELPAREPEPERQVVGDLFPRATDVRGMLTRIVRGAGGG